MKVTIVFKNGSAKDYNRVYNIHDSEGILIVTYYGIEGSVYARGHKLKDIEHIIVKEM